MTLAKLIACAVLLLSCWSAAQAQQQNVSGEITFKKGKTQSFTFFSNGYSNAQLQYLEEIGDFKQFQGSIMTGTSTRSIQLTSISKIDFVEMTKEERAAIEASKNDPEQVRKASVVLRNENRLDGVFIPFLPGAKWSDGNITGDPRDLKIVSITFTR